MTNTVAQVFMNIVLDEAFEEKAGGEKVAIGMIVSSPECTERPEFWLTRIFYRSFAVTRS